MHSLFFLLALWGGRAHAAHFEPPDYQREYQFHHQWEMMNASHAPGDAPVEGRTESYRLQKGETLWSLSKMLYGDGNYWPKVWSQNPDITNPHLIRPGYTLQFFVGSEDSVPGFRFSEGGDSKLELASAPVVGPPGVEIPPPEHFHPLISLPNSFPPWQQVFREPPKLQVNDKGLTREPIHVKKSFYLTGYVQSLPLDPIGTYLESESESGLPVPMQYAYVELNKGIGQIGEKFLIVSDGGLLKRINPAMPRLKAHLINIFGELQLTDLVEPDAAHKKDMKKYDTYRALLTHVTGLTLSRFSLIPGQLQKIDMESNGQMGDVSAQIIGSVRHRASALYGPGDVVFLDKGDQDGVAVGQLLDIYIDRTTRYPNTPIRYAKQASGLLKIVKVGDHLSTAVILFARDGIQQGDLAKPGEQTLDSSAAPPGPDPDKYFSGSSGIDPGPSDN